MCHDVSLMTEWLVISSVVRHEQCQLVQLYEYTYPSLNFPSSTQQQSNIHSDHKLHLTNTYHKQSQLPQCPPLFRLSQSRSTSSWRRVRNIQSRYSSRSYKSTKAWKTSPIMIAERTTSPLLSKRAATHMSRWRKSFGPSSTRLMFSRLGRRKESWFCMRTITVRTLWETSTQASRHNKFAPLHHTLCGRGGWSGTQEMTTGGDDVLPKQPKVKVWVRSL